MEACTHRGGHIDRGDILMWWFEKEEDCGTARGMARGTVRGMARGMVRGTVQGTARKHKILTTRFVLRSVVVLSIKACTGGGLSLIHI